MSICCLFKGLIPTQYKVCGLLSYFHIVMEKGRYMPDSACLNNIQPAYYETYHKASTDRQRFKFSLIQFFYAGAVALINLPKTLRKTGLPLPASLPYGGRALTGKSTGVQAETHSIVKKIRFF